MKLFLLLSNLVFHSRVWLASHHPQSSRNAKRATRLLLRVCCRPAAPRPAVAGLIPISSAATLSPEGMQPLQLALWTVFLRVFRYSSQAPLGPIELSELSKRNHDISHPPFLTSVKPT